MFVTVDEFSAIYDQSDNVNKRQALLAVAQFVIEIYVGRTEAEVVNARDKEMLARAVMAQAMYMEDSFDATFQQIAAVSVQRGDGMTVFDVNKDSPFIAPLAIMACKHVSWKKSHSVTIGKTFGTAEKARALYWLSIWGELSAYGSGFGMDGSSPSEYGLLPFNPEVWSEV